MRLTTFQVEITPPVGHPLCGGWHPPAIGVDDPLVAGGVIFLPDGQAPLVLCAIEWCELSNRSHLAWKRALAEAVGTTANRVAVHCTHPHCTPWPDEVAQKLVETQPGVRAVMDAAWCDGALQSVADAARATQSTPRRVTHLEMGRARVEQVASNRRIPGEDGKIKAVRWTKTTDPAVRAEPEGLIDPWLKTISFWNEEEKLAALHYYAVHPTSYEDFRITPEFTGLARARRQAQDGDVPHLYFTECAGDITAGKHNDGATENRELFTDRVLRAMVKSENDARRLPLPALEWRTVEVNLPPRPDMIEGDLLAALRDGALNDVERIHAAMKLSYLERGDTPIEIAALHLGDALSVLHLPGEAFIEYQLFAQAQRPAAMVVAPAYGDCGPGYICLEKSFDEGGYEPTDSFVAPRSEHLMKDAIARVMAPQETS
jgi:hypothetical protein